MKKIILASLVLWIACPAFAEDVVSHSDEKEVATIESRAERWHNQLKEQGYTVEVAYTGDFVSNTSGGIKRGNAYLGNLDLLATVDTEKAGFWQGGTFFVYGLYNFGNERPSSKFVGDMQGVNNIDAPRLFKLYELWYEHRFFDDKLSARMGLYDLNSEFDNTEYGGLFINSSFGIEPTIALNTTASIFPITGPAFRLKWDPAAFLTLQTAILTGNPGDEDDNPHGFDIGFNKKRGNMVVAETQVHGDVPLPVVGMLPGTLKVGAWYNSRPVDDISGDVDGNGDPVRHDGNSGFYAVIDQMFFREKDEQGLGAFFQYGQAPNDRNTLNQYYGMGLNYKGIVPGRDEDVFGIAVNRAILSDDLRSTGDFDKFEDVLEISYLIQLTENISIQPDFQIVHNPNSDPTIKDAKVVTLRTVIDY